MLELFGEYIAFVTAVFTFAHLSVGYKVLAVHAIISFIVEYIGFVARKRGSSVQWLFNCYVVIDCNLMLLTAYLLKVRLSIFICILAYIAFASIWITDMLHDSNSKFTIRAFIADSAVLFGLYMFVLYRISMTYNGSIIKSPDFWLCLATILYYGCSIPFFSMLDYLTRTGSNTFILKHLSSYFLFIVVQVLINLRFLFVAYSFFLSYKRPESKNR